MMTLANKITLIRAALAIVMFLFILAPFGWARLVATLIFILAASTDWVDGKIARETNTITPFGAIVDPFVDKILVIAAFAFGKSTQNDNGRYPRKDTKQYPQSRQRYHEQIFDIVYKYF